jgi:hypothetical protein
LRESPAARDIPVFLTALSDARDEEHRLELDAADYIQSVRGHDPVGGSTLAENGRGDT